jgi:hypothetical protein
MVDIFFGSEIRNVSFPWASPSGAVSKVRLNALLNIFGNMAANSRLSVTIRIPSTEKLLAKSKIPKHSAKAQQFFADTQRLTSALAAAENEMAI